MSHGHYVNDDTVDMHGVLVGRWRPGTVFAIGRAGLFSRTDRGEHWASARLEPLNPKGRTYCRDIREVPGDPKTIWVAAGANFQSDLGVLFRSKATPAVPPIPLGFGRTEAPPASLTVRRAGRGSCRGREL